jgi:hypothetical protein
VNENANNASEKVTQNEYLHSIERRVIWGIKCKALNFEYYYLTMAPESEIRPSQSSASIQIF